MTESSNAGSGEASGNPGTDDLAIYDRLIPRVLRNILIAGVVFVAVAYRYYGWPGVVGFAAGTAVSYINFRSLSRGVEALTDRIANQNSRERGGWILLRFVIRYGLVGAAAYAIFKSSGVAFRGFLWGLCVPVGALLAEAIWEGFTALRRV